MPLFKKAGVVLFLLLIAIQFLRPSLEAGPVNGADAIGNVVKVPAHVQQLLKQACYDCHSYQTNKPWYWYTQPAGWFLAHHIGNARKVLNFSVFGSYSKRRQSHKLMSVSDQIRTGEMPMQSYRLLHSEARLNASEKEEILSWADSLSEHLE